MQFYLDDDFTLRKSLFGVVKLTENADPDKYSYSGSGISFNVGGTFSLSDGSGFSKYVVMFGVDMSSSGHVNNRKKDIIILEKSPTQALDNTTLTTRAEYSINFTGKEKIFV